MEKMTKLYDKILEKGFTYHESKEELPRGKSGRKRHRRGHNLLMRLRKNKNSILRFMYEEKVPFSNNQAEFDDKKKKKTIFLTKILKSLFSSYNHI